MMLIRARAFRGLIILSDYFDFFAFERPKIAWALIAENGRDVTKIGLVAH